MADNREAILKGAKAAHTLHRDLGVRESIERDWTSRIDVFGAVSKLGGTLMFQRLDKLLGAYLPGAEPGVLITTERTLPVQRFTCAHELGHLYMQHEPSLDDEQILRRAPFSSSSTINHQEREADAFASMFLTPAWLVAQLLERQQWTADKLLNPVTAYQASLRLGTSYAATCYALERHRVLNRVQRDNLLATEPKEIKKAILTHYKPPDWRADVWVISDRDEGALIEGGRNDVFVVQLRENSGAGYLWSFEELERAGFTIVSDDQESEEPDDSEAVGGVLTRRVTARSGSRTRCNVTLHEERPWIPQKRSNEFHLRCDLRGPEEAGMWEPELLRALQVA
jgi:Zn-dependent peptidase ImmA (M78 family)/predicted secreted protein